MSPRPLLIAGFIGSIVAGIALFVAALGVVALDAAAHGGHVMAIVILAVFVALVLDSILLCFTVDRLAKLGEDGDGEEGGGPGGGGGGPGAAPRGSGSPCGDPAWWPEFERALRVYSERRRHAVVK